jgi:hypothetical protein
MPNAIFKNNTSLPVLIRTWIEPFNGVKIMNHVYCHPYSIMEIHSKQGEWFIDNLFSEKKDFDIWYEKGYKICGHLGKFSQKRFSNETSIRMFSTDFSCIAKNGIFYFIETKKPTSSVSPSSPHSI